MLILTADGSAFSETLARMNSSRRIHHQASPTQTGRNLAPCSILTLSYHEHLHFWSTGYATPMCNGACYSLSAVSRSTLIRSLCSYTASF